MTFWLNEYIFAIGERDRKEKTGQVFYNKYTRLADRLAAHQSISTKTQTHAKNEKSTVECNKAQLDAKEQQSSSFIDTDALQKALQDLGEAQRSRGATELRLLQLADQTKKLFTQSRSNCKRIAELASEKTQLAARMRDRDEELKAKTKLLENVHDETVSLTLQLNMAEEKTQTLQRENKELVDRWMVRMGEEADAMNKASSFS